MTEANPEETESKHPRVVGMIELIGLQHIN